MPTDCLVWRDAEGGTKRERERKKKERERGRTFEGDFLSGWREWWNGRELGYRCVG